MLGGERGGGEGGKGCSHTDLTSLPLSFLPAAQWACQVSGEAAV